jgi:carbonic anhydrase
MKKITIECTASQLTATLIFESGLLVNWNWRCKEGPEMWGGSGKGTAPSNLLINQGPEEIPLNNSDYLYDTKNLAIGSIGKGYRADNYGGIFPAGDFDWECTEIN